MLKPFEKSNLSIQIQGQGNNFKDIETTLIDRNRNLQ